MMIKTADNGCKSIQKKGGANDVLAQAFKTSYVGDTFYKYFDSFDSMMMWVNDMRANGNMVLFVGTYSWIRKDLTVFL